MSRKYIEDLEDYDDYSFNKNTDDPRSKKWAKDREIYGFDERETWSLDHSMTELLYERLMMFKEITTNTIETDKPKLDTSELKYTKNQEMTQLEIINEMLESCKKVLDPKSFHNEDERDKASNKLWELWLFIHPAMWW